MIKSSFLVSLCKKQRKQDVARDFENCGKSVGVMTKPPNVLGQNWTQNWKIFHICVVVHIINLKSFVAVHLPYTVLLKLKQSLLVLF